MMKALTIFNGCISLKKGYRPAVLFSRVPGTSSSCGVQQSSGTSSTIYVTQYKHLHQNKFRKACFCVFNMGYYVQDYYIHFLNLVCVPKLHPNHNIVHYSTQDCGFVSYWGYPLVDIYERMTVSGFVLQCLQNRHINIIIYTTERLITYPIININIIKYPITYTIPHSYHN